MALAHATSSTGSGSASSSDGCGWDLDKGPQGANGPRRRCCNQRLYQTLTHAAMPASLPLSIRHTYSLQGYSSLPQQTSPNSWLPPEKNSITPPPSTRDTLQSSNRNPDVTRSDQPRKTRQCGEDVLGCSRRAAAAFTDVNCQCTCCISRQLQRKNEYCSENQRDILNADDERI